MPLTPSPFPGPRLPLWVALVLAAGSGVAFDAAFPDRAWWALAPLALVGFFVALTGRGFWSGALTGLVGAGAFWLVHIEWLTLYLGLVPWLALAVVQTLFYAVGFGLIALLLTRGQLVFSGRGGRLLLLPVLVAGLWTGIEGLTAVWPYDGFAWGRVAASQTEGAFASLLGWIGPAGTGFVLAWVAAFAVQLGRETIRERMPSLAATEAPAGALRGRHPFTGTPGTRGRLLVRLTGLTAAVAVLAVFPAWPAPTEGTLKLAAVQGGVDASLFSATPSNEIMQAHIDETVRGVDEDVELVVWPENGVALDPERVPASAEVLDSLTERYGAAFTGGTIQERDGEFFNTSLLWEEGAGLTDRYDKAHPVPFAEYMPDRAFWRPFAPELIDMVTRDYTKGTRDNVFDVAGIVAGVAICFDIADDHLVHTMIDDGAELILAQTNNADFGHTDESLQQLAIARMRAIETGRSVVNISTVGTSAIIRPDGSTMADLPTWQPGTMIEAVPLATTVTPASLLGRQIEQLVSFFALAGALIVMLRRNPGAERGSR
ncbi:apolipoprotein N-acyltransferase [Agromyces archimandritae]|uniref:Apolipoprotein N-acyltransferase n=1 Tax=Agromyces archimandritae TaxID=2781962 RepID=A0A975FMQ8_9MICO|nr:apolipoprotein N-acyltransferase [Agromyces archimandritae]QTX04766.1 apolipoprotein N-acyltransferase [Agromyces archimandritae]